MTQADDDSNSSIPISALIISISNAVDAVNPLLSDHHKRVAYIVLRLCDQMKISGKERSNLVIAALLHDLGAFNHHDRIVFLEDESSDISHHAEMSYFLIKAFKPFSEVAQIVRLHHSHWKRDRDAESGELLAPEACHILHLADRIAGQIRPDEQILKQVNRIRQTILAQSGEMFNPDHVKHFVALSKLEYFWLDLVSGSVDSILMEEVEFELIAMDDDVLLEVSNMFRKVVDYRSSFTATHSAGVAYSAEALSRYQGFSEGDARRMRVAGYLHDLGKLSIPVEILEKERRLEATEYTLMRTHPYVTHHILRPMSAFKEIREWASFHHERLDGAGYPFHLKKEQLSLGSRILAVADVFVALAENRPYRGGLTREQALPILRQMSDSGALDREIVESIDKYFDEINATRIREQEAARTEFRGMMESRVQ